MEQKQRAIVPIKFQEADVESDKGIRSTIPLSMECRLCSKIHMLDSSFSSRCREQEQKSLAHYHGV